MAGEKPDAVRHIAPGVLQPFSLMPPTFIELRDKRGRLGDIPSAGAYDNKVPEARLALERLLRLWAITVADYKAALQLWQPLQPIDRLYGDNLKPLAAAIRKAVEPTLANEVANELLPVHLPPGGWVGAGGTVTGDDLASVQRAFQALGIMKDAEVKANDSGATLRAIREFKVRFVEMKLGWTAIHADEDCFGADRFGGRTYGPFPGRIGGESFSAFIPKGAPLDANYVHVHFSPGRVTPGTVREDDGLNAILMHGLRGAFFESKWIVIGVEGYEAPPPEDKDKLKDWDQEKENKKGLNYISTADIETILGKIGRSKTDIERITLSAHSRGSNALIYTLGGVPIAGAKGLGKPSIDTGKVDQITVFDHIDPAVGTAVRAAGLQGKARIYLATEDNNPTGLPSVELRSPQITNRVLAKDCFRAIGYVRLIQDAIRRGVISPPPDTMDLVNLLLNGSPPLPDRGKLTSKSLPAFCAAHASAQSNMQKILDDKTGLREYFYTNRMTIARLKDVYAASVDRHHFFVAEVAHELVLP